MAEVLLVEDEKNLAALFEDLLTRRGHSVVVCTTLASASSTFMWPGMRPATGWIAYLTSTPAFLSASAISRSACCAWATAMP